MRAQENLTFIICMHYHVISIICIVSSDRPPGLGHDVLSAEQIHCNDGTCARYLRPGMIRVFRISVAFDDSVHPSL